MAKKDKKQEKTITEILAEISTADESWVNIENWPDYYISSLGRVYSTKTKSIMQTKLNSSGYPRVHLTDARNGSRKDQMVLLHRLVALHFLPNPGNKPCVDHIDEDKTNAAASNLRWCTYKENIKWFYDNKKRRRAEMEEARRAIMDDLIAAMQETSISINTTLSVAKQLQEELA